MEFYTLLLIVADDSGDTHIFFLFQNQMQAMETKNYSINRLLTCADDRSDIVQTITITVKDNNNDKSNNKYM